MTSKILVLLGLSTALVGCGDYSNEDLLFVNAIPRSEDLRSKLAPPEQNALTAAPPYNGALVDPANGDLSALTRGGSAVFNSALDGLFGLLEAAIQHPPTTREPGRRIWGPFVDGQAPAWEVRLVMERLDDVRFAYRVEIHQRTNGSSEWTSILDGELEPLPGIRRSRGTMWLRAGAARLAGRETPDLDWLDTISAEYDSGGFPVSVLLHGVGVPTAPIDILYTYREEEDRSGALAFNTTYSNVPGVGTLGLAITSRWLPSGAGEAQAQVTAGSVVGASWVQCWNAAFGLVYSYRSWATPPEGSSLECPSFPLP